MCTDKIDLKACGASQREAAEDIRKGSVGCWVGCVLKFAQLGTWLISSMIESLLGMLVNQGTAQLNLCSLIAHLKLGCV